jgi:DNA repair protein SbcD/Mre11
MRIVLFSDLHLETHFAWAPPHVARRRRRALEDTLVKIVELAEEVEADLVCCGGDLYEDERFTPDTIAFVRSVLAEAGRPVHIAPGNHDWYGPASLYAQVAWPAHVHVFDRDELTPLTLEEGLTLWGAAHLGPANTDGFLDRGFRVDRGGVHLALFHGSERAGLPHETDGKVPHAPFDAEQIPAAGLHHAMLGHFHSPREGPHHTYPGNPEPLTFGEEGLRGAVVLDVADDGTVARQWHEVAVSEVHDIALDVTGCASNRDIRQLIHATLRTLSGAVRLDLHGELDPEVELDRRELDEVAAEVDEVEAVVLRARRVRVAYDLDAIAAETTVRGRFVRDVLDADLDEDEQRRIIVTGLRAMDGRDDLEVA